MLLSRSRWLCGSVGALLWLAASAQAAKITVLVSRTAEPYLAAVRGLEQTLAGGTEVVNMEGDAEKGRQLVAAASGSSLLIAVGTEAGLAARSAGEALPVVYTMVMDAPDYGARKASGVAIKIGIGDQFARIQKLFPGKKRIGVVYNPQYSSQDIDQARKLAGKYDLSLSPIAVEKPEEVGDALLKLTGSTVDLLWMVPDKMLAQAAPVQSLIAHAQRESLPLIGLSMYHVKLGALAAFSVDFADIGSQTGKLAQRWLADGVRPAPETPRKVIVFVNPKVQKQIGIEDLSVFPEVNYIQ